MTVAREYDGDRSASAESDGGVDVVKNWGRHRREVILHIDD
jgi:hypothetical protein